MNTEFRLVPSGDCAITIRFHEEISNEINDLVRAIYQAMLAISMEGIIEVTPTYNTLMITYNPLKISYKTLVDRLNTLMETVDKFEIPISKNVDIPTLYGGEHGPDLEYVAHLNHLSTEEVINIHTSTVYRIFMLGFTPGFPYLGGMDERIASPRRTEPRLKIPAGAVGIAGVQTGIYPIESPGGWQIIGQTPLELYNPSRKEPILLKAGDSLRFVPISQETFNQIKAENVLENVLENDLSFNSDYPFEDKHITIHKPGLLTLVEDMGRYGYQAFGVPVSGVMDTFAAQMANLLVSNTREEAVLEITLSGPEILFNFNGYIAITGGDLVPMLNQQSIQMWETLCVQKGDILSFKGLKAGTRSYLAIAGGIQVKTVMNSKSTYTKAHLGGHNGRALIKGDCLKVGDCTKKIIRKMIAPMMIPVYKNVIKIRVIMGPQLEHFNENGIHTFLSSVYHLTIDCDRMGYRLEGPTIEHSGGADILSDGISFGAIQVPGNGKPIIMMADRQTTGGYAKIANVISADLPKLAQAKSGDQITFHQVSVEQAQEIYKTYEDYFLEIDND